MLYYVTGEPAVGKSSTFLRYTKKQFDYSYQPSVSVAIGNVVKKIRIPYHTVVSVVMWDVNQDEKKWILERVITRMWTQQLVRKNYCV